MTLGGVVLSFGFLRCVGWVCRLCLVFWGFCIFCLCCLWRGWLVVLLGLCFF